jgi:hypothetical protein
MPSISTEAGQGDICDDRANPEGLAWKIDGEGVSHETPAPIGPNEIPDAKSTCS